MSDRLVAHHGDRDVREDIVGRCAWIVFLRLQRAARLARTWGDGYGYLMVATGRAEVMIDPVVNLWDAAPLQPIIEEAGGQFTDWHGNANDPRRRSDCHQWLG